MTEFIVLLGSSFLLSVGIFISALFFWHGFDRLDRLNAQGKRILSLAQNMV